MSLVNLLASGGLTFSRDFGFINSHSKTANSATYNFTSLNIGEEHPERMVVVAVMSGSTFGISSATIAGVPATVKSGGSLTNFIYAKVPSGSTGQTISVTFSSTVANCMIAIWKFNTKKTTHLDVAHDDKILTTTNLVMSNVQCKTDGIVFSCFSGNDTGTATFTWNGVDSFSSNGNTTVESGRKRFGRVLTTEDSTVRDMTIVRGSPQAAYAGSTISFEFEN